jgi:hypothetical protein
MDDDYDTGPRSHDALRTGRGSRVASVQHPDIANVGTDMRGDNKNNIQGLDSSCCTGGIHIPWLSTKADCKSNMCVPHFAG